MLPQIFRPDSPVFQLALPPEHQQKLERLLADLPQEVFHASDSLGWVYQFWQAKRKDAVNASEVKIGARELPAVTQLFTEPYMVAFLLDNSLGAWWVGELSGARHQFSEELRPGAVEMLRTAKTEDELRAFFSLPGVPLEYLRFVQTPTGDCELVPEDISGAWKLETEHSIRWRPASGWFDGWPEQLADLKTIDPCCGSGHFLVAACLMLVPMRMERDGLSAKEAVDAVLRENIHGLELDQRCVELAAFALALAAWKYPAASGYRQLPELNVACSGLSISAKKEEWLALADGDNSLSFYLEQIYKLFKNAPTLGSLIDPGRMFKDNSLFTQDWKGIQPLLSMALAKEKGDEKIEMGVVAKGLAKAADLLCEKFAWIVTNVPYLMIKHQEKSLKEFLTSAYPRSKYDLAVAMVDRFIGGLLPGGTIGVVVPLNWTYLGSYKTLRTHLLNHCQFNSLAMLGPGAFEGISGEVVKVVLFTATCHSPTKQSSFFGVDCIPLAPAQQKARGLSEILPEQLSQLAMTQNPDARISISAISTSSLLENIAFSKRGIVNGDNDKWTRACWEVVPGKRWRFLQVAVAKTACFSGRTRVIDWSTEGKGMLRPGVDNPTYGKRGVAVSRMSLCSSNYTGEFYDQNTAVIVLEDSSELPALWCYCVSDEFPKAVRKLDKNISVTPATFLKIPFDAKRWSQIAADAFPNGLPKPYSDDPTQWIFHGHPCESVQWSDTSHKLEFGPLRTDNTVLQVAVARLLGYRWPAELDKDMELSDEARTLVARCDDLLKFADKDGIVCIPAVRGESTAADRLLNLLAAVWKGSSGQAPGASGRSSGDWNLASGNSAFPAWVARLLADAGYGGKSLDTWLRDQFFIQHCSLFHQRPFIWHIWDGLRDGFSALVNYHKLNRKNLETLIYTYLGDWIKRQKDDIASGVDGAQERLAAAETLKKRLELILAGEAPYDIFVRWKPIEEQPIGWNPDINDGVRLNIRPFMSVADVKKRGAGVLREKPRINWKKDRGKDVDTAPWYHLGPEYGGKEGDRINDHHLSLEKKRAAQEAAE